MKITKDNELKFEKQFGSFFPLFRRFIETEEFDKIFAFLKSETAKGKQIIPVAADVFKSFEYTNRHKMKALILLQCPYATKNHDKIISNGIPMDCSNIAPYQQPSLHQWYQGLEKAYGFHPDNDLRCNLEYLLKEEGVMLLNCSLTVEQDKPDSHMELWKPFMKFFIEEIINRFTCGLPIVLVGTTAQQYESAISPMCHHVLKVEHPAFAARENREWRTKECFQWINNIIRQNNGPEHEIQWMRLKSDPVRKHIVSDPGPEDFSLPF